MRPREAVNAEAAPTTADGVASPPGGAAGASRLKGGRRAPLGEGAPAMINAAELDREALAAAKNSPAPLRAFAILLQAYDYAAKLGRDRWEFAVEIRVLRAAGLTYSDLRWLRCKDYVEHSTEITA